MKTSLIITYGPTHSGKTTFGRRLMERLGNDAKYIHVDNDEVDMFVRAHYQNLRTDPVVLARRTPSDPDLRLLIPQTIVEYALKEGYGAIVTAGHPKYAIRNKYFQIAKKYRAETILLIFQVSEATLVERIASGKRDSSVLDANPQDTKGFMNLHEKQKTMYDLPSEQEQKEYTHVFYITEDNTSSVLDEISSLLTDIQ